MYKSNITLHKHADMPRLDIKRQREAEIRHKLQNQGGGGGRPRGKETKTKEAPPETKTFSNPEHLNPKKIIKNNTRTDIKVKEKFRTKSK